jgi:hypothetical protein
VTGKIALGKNYVFISAFPENLVSSVLNSDIMKRNRRAERQGKAKRLECMEGTRSTLKNVGGEREQTDTCSRSLRISAPTEKEL